MIASGIPARSKAFTASGIGQPTQCASHSPVSVAAYAICGAGWRLSITVGALQIWCAGSTQALVKYVPECARTMSTLCALKYSPASLAATSESTRPKLNTSPHWLTRLSINPL